MAFTKSVRKNLPVMAAFIGESGSGKTYSSLLFARGLVGPEGRIAAIDTERGRMSAFADDPDIGGFDDQVMYPPFSAPRFVELINEAIEARCDALVIDSITHEWSGLGGAIDQADRSSAKAPSNWIKPKLQHKRMMNAVLQAPMHVIFCVRAGFKMHPFVDDNGKQQFAMTNEVVADQEKTFIFEMTLSAIIDRKTHIARFVKMPKPLVGQLADRVINVSSGAAVRSWVNGGAAVDPLMQALKAKAREAAAEGLMALQHFWEAVLLKDQRLALADLLPELKSIASAAEDDFTGGEPLTGTPGNANDTSKLHDDGFSDDPSRDIPPPEQNTAEDPYTF